MAKFKIELNDAGNIRDILQRAYDLSDMQIVQSQNEINKLASATRLQDEAMDSKGKYSKAINDYLSIIDKSISKKMEIAKLLTEILQHGGNTNIDGSENTGAKTFDLTKIKEIVKNMHQNNTEETKTIELNKK